MGKGVDRQSRNRKEWSSEERLAHENAVAYKKQKKVEKDASASKEGFGKLFKQQRPTTQNNSVASLASSSSSQNSYQSQLSPPQLPPPTLPPSHHHQQEQQQQRRPSDLNQHLQQSSPLNPSHQQQHTSLSPPTPLPPQPPPPPPPNPDGKRGSLPLIDREEDFDTIETDDQSQMGLLIKMVKGLECSSRNFRGVRFRSSRFLVLPPKS